VASTTTLTAGHFVAELTASDINGDGLSDVIVAKDSDWNGTTGSMDVYLGTPAGLSAKPTEFQYSTTWTQSSYFSVGVLDAGDINGDGYGDILVALPTVGSYGSIDVYFGSATGLSPTPITLASPLDEMILFGEYAAGVGDVDGDGFDDLVAGTWNHPPVGLFVYRGGPQGMSVTPDLAVSAPASANGEFGSPVNYIGDVNGDGFADVGVGSQGSGGPIFVYLGGANVFANSPLVVNPPDGGTNFGWSFE
jgi:hypothetical protein